MSLSGPNRSKYGQSRSIAPDIFTPYPRNADNRSPRVAGSAVSGDEAEFRSDTDASGHVVGSTCPAASVGSGPDQYQWCACQKAQAPHGLPYRLFM
ncbi:hypothetical protein GCM10009663_74400 [Kitasatospora arboriphila]|uniref:Uncharacterized protein n=1 Tax=Kitasatospora arboriphila TaxID=258052 RepID=A0ABP4EPS5_9ACTN